MNLTNISRFKAFLIHFLISLFVFLILLYFILIQWYPSPLFENDGGWRVIRIIVGIDLVLGPLLTLIVFKPGKPGLKFDLTMIAVAQTLALSWGVWTTYNERPAAVIYTIDHFTPVPAYQLAQQGIGSKELEKFGDSWPVLIFSDIPQENLSFALKTAMQEAKPLYLFKQYYKKFTPEYTGALKRSSMNLEKYVEDKPELKKRYQEAILNLTPNKTNTVFLALHSREKWITVIFDLDTMQMLDTIDIEPSKYFYAQKIKRQKKK